MFEKIIWITALSITVLAGLIAAAAVCVEVMQTYYIRSKKLVPPCLRREAHKTLVINLLSFVLAAAVMTKFGWLGQWLALMYFTANAFHHSKLIEKNQDTIDKAEGRK